ncbi:hypothetical protein [Kitasatospora cathayae]|uniref:HNH nuclease domain-containing protein n=1 Tax=Kitasatospora cathayae TaxID=3004092 RepID=A0ABY7QJP5_9ACTN|nr:hypothetical protein [Kitasatospora sp. HUAS 3-15]WBP92091.1 hypothetical protein O1G21_40895 [Kitasatospora sp. HUAS 3-15]
MKHAAVSHGIRSSSDAGYLALCGRALPATLLTAAHIKKHAVCTDDEKRDFANIAMLACSLGCDSLYERGYITVTDTGRIQVSPLAHTMPGVHEHIQQHLTDRTVLVDPGTRAPLPLAPHPHLQTRPAHVTAHAACRNTSQRKQMAARQPAWRPASAHHLPCRAAWHHGARSLTPQQLAKSAISPAIQHGQETAKAALRRRLESLLPAPAGVSRALTPP